MLQKETPLGLRERKKQITRTTIQLHALKLFRVQGYGASSVVDIASAAGISEATFYRYFPTKEDVVLQDDYDPVLLAAFEAQPAGLSPIQALRATFQHALDSFSETEWQTQRERIALINAEPKLRARMLDQITETMRLLVGPIAKRSGRGSDDFAVLTVAGAIMGVCIAAVEAARLNPKADLLQLLDAALAQLEAGLDL